jgi:phosphatidylserine/phosphatidylglycerophosphate/cardiolipin synthase-like enzyme
MKPPTLRLPRIVLAALAALILPLSAHAKEARTPKSLADFLGLQALSGFYDNEEGSPLFDLIDSAKKTIDIEIYMMDDRDLHSALRRAMRERGVRIRVVKDPSPLGETCNPFKEATDSDTEKCADYKALAAEIKSRGGAFVPFNKKELCGIEGKSCFQHGKMVIIDSKKVMLSTGNFNPSSLCNDNQNPSKCNRDYSFVSRRPLVVDTLEAIFEHDLKGERYDPRTLMSKRSANKITVSPFSEEPLVEWIDSARRSVEVQNQYLKEEAINAALVRAASRGVDVKITLASACSFGKPKDKQRADLTRLFQSFDAAGIKTRMFTRQIEVGGKPGYMHAKAILVDGRRAWVGSVNGSSMSVRQNREFGIFFRNPFSVHHLKRILREDHADPRGETWQESLDCVKD